MKVNLRSTLLALASFGVLLAGGCRQHDDAPAGDKTNAPASAPAPPKQAEAQPAAGTDLRLDAGAQQRLGLKMLALESYQLQAEFTVYGHVLDPAPLAALNTELATAQAALSASQKEYERLKALYGQDQNASLRALQAADATAARDQLQVASTQQRLVLNWGHTIADDPNLPAFVRALAKLETALVRIDFPPGEVVAPPPLTARLLTIRQASEPLGAAFVSPAPAVDPQTQEQSFFFLVKSNAARLTPGTAFTAWLPKPGALETGVVVPRGAVLHYQGLTWVFLQNSGTSFVRRPVSLGPPLAAGWFTTNGVKAKDTVVVEGAQALLSEELNSANSFRNQRD